ncbi:MAG: 3-deoxy-D-manno-octulosonic acid transferase [Alphaproteobacteria bacterium]|nr:3-deoxy-D-manno-octulosonic acid transferase [Alphaproteobacteria bacterium]
MAGLTLYRGLTGLGAPLINFYMQRRLASGKEDPDRISERRGVASRPRPDGPLAWVHAASVGEAQSALSLITKMLRARIDLHILITTGTVTSAKLLAERLPPRSFHQFVPVDHQRWVQRFLDHWEPNLAVWIESEFWPNLIAETAERNIPTVLANGRISRKSAANWRFVPGFISNIVGEFQLCLTQTEEEAARFRALGADPVKCVGNLKFSAAALPVDDAELTAVAGTMQDRLRWLAASTHPGEESMAVEAHLHLRDRVPDLLTVIVPRHPSRGAKIAQEIAAQGLRVSRRGAGEPISPDDDFHVADTLGELGLFYRLTDIAFIGGTMDSHGGHNPLEAAQLDCAILHGPDMANFATVSQQLAVAGATKEISNAETLAAAVADFLNDPESRQASITAAADVAQSNASVVDHVIEELQPFLNALPPGNSDARA